MVPTTSANEDRDLATYVDLRIGGVEIIVRNLMDLSVVTP